MQVDLQASAPGRLMIIATVIGVAAVGLGIGLFGSKIAGGGQ